MCKDTVVSAPGDFAQGLGLPRTVEPLTEGCPPLHPPPPPWAPLGAWEAPWGRLCVTLRGRCLEVGRGLGLHGGTWAKVPIPLSLLSFVQPHLMAPVAVNSCTSELPGQAIPVSLVSPELTCAQFKSELFPTQLLGSSSLSPGSSAISYPTQIEHPLPTPLSFHTFWVVYFFFFLRVGGTGSLF